MSQEFHHYLRSLWNCRLKPSQASRHITGVWAEVLKDRVTDYYLDLEQRQAPPLRDREHVESCKQGTAVDQGLHKQRRMENAVNQGLPKHHHQGAFVDQEHAGFSQHKDLGNGNILGQENYHAIQRKGEQQRLRGFNEQYPSQFRAGKQNMGGAGNENGCQDGSQKNSEGGASVGANFKHNSDPDVGTSFDENTGRNFSRTPENKLRECREKPAETTNMAVSSSNPKTDRNSSVGGCGGEVCGSSSVSSQLKKPRYLNLISERYRSITSLSKQTVSRVSV